MAQTLILSTSKAAAMHISITQMNFGSDPLFYPVANLTSPTCMWRTVLAHNTITS
jgi:hypothetical protein